MFERIKKRDGRHLAFDALKITEAIARAGKASGEFDEREARKLTLRVLTLAHEMGLGSVPEVEEIQDIVERVLLASPFYKTAKAYILYREQHAQIRNIVSKASEDLPDPLKPVITVSLLRGISTLIFFKLCSLAPIILINFHSMSLLSLSV